VLKFPDITKTGAGRTIYARGKAEGRVEGKLGLLLNILERRFGKLPAATTAEIERLDYVKLEQMGDKALDFPDADAVADWLRKGRKPAKS
jgi:hypothetical protein